MSDSSSKDAGSQRDEEQHEELRVTDKRRFSADGSAREGETRDAVPPKVNSEEADLKGSDDAHDDAGARPKIDFPAFVMSLATQALMHLGEIQAPEGMDVQVDVQAAGETIDILAMLSEKTKGNLDETEDRLMTEILHHLRMSYVKKK